MNNFCQFLRNEIVSVRVLICAGVVPNSGLVWLMVGRIGQEWVPFVVGLVCGAGVIFFEGNFKIVQ